MEIIFAQITALLVLTVGVAWFTRLLRQPIVIAYIFAGIAAGPLIFNIIQKGSDDFALFSQLGVILLLFIIGLSLNFNYIKKIGKIAVIGGIGQAIFTAAIAFGILQFFFDFATLPALYLSIAITFSSTIIITKLLSDSKQTDSLYGRHTIGLLLVQDVIAIILMIFLTISGEGGGLSESVIKLLLGGLFLISGVILMAKYILPFILKRIADSTEFLFLFSIAWCFFLAYLAESLGFSYEIGAIAAGIALGSSPYQPEINARITPLKDFFLIIFFILLGAELNFSTLNSAVIPSIALALFILVGNPLILYILYRSMKFTRKTSLFIGLTAAQVSEFGFVLLYLGRESGHVGEPEIAIFTLVALSTIFISAYLITYNEAVSRFLNPLLSIFKKKDYEQIEEKAPIYDIWVIGYHRIGWNIVNALRGKNSSFAVIDFDPTVIETLGKAKIPAYFIDVGDASLLSELPLDKAKLIISTIPNIESQLALIRHIKSHSSETVVIANAPEAKYMSSLYGAGADYVMTPHLLGGKWISSLIGSNKIDRSELEKLRKEQDEEISGGLPIHTL